MIYYMIDYMKSPNSPDIPNSLNEHWMPFSSNKDFKKNPRIIVEAEGIYLKTHQGNTLIDGSSGLYCNPLGHGRKEIIDAIQFYGKCDYTNYLKKLIS